MHSGSYGVADFFGGCGISYRVWNTTHGTRMIFVSNSRRSFPRDSICTAHRASCGPFTSLNVCVDLPLECSAERLVSLIYYVKHQSKAARRCRINSPTRIETYGIFSWNDSGQEGIRDTRFSVNEPKARAIIRRQGILMVRRRFTILRG